MRFSQNQEQEVIGKYFGGRPGTFLDIGANDGQTFSNTRNLAVHQWPGVCVEPSPSAYSELSKLYAERPDVHCFRFAIGSESATGSLLTLHEGSDTLVSSLDPSRLGMWEGMGMSFGKVKVPVVSFQHLMEVSPYQKFDMVSIDAEGLDWPILRQMDLDAMGVKLLVIEYGTEERNILGHCAGFHIIHRNGENLILAR